MAKQSVKHASDKRLHIVAIGASAGGIEALENVFRNLPIGINVCYIVAQHLSPTHPSMLRDLVERYTGLRVVTIKRSQLLKPRTVYITPPNKDVEVLEGKIRLLPTTADIGANPSINRLFYSLAKDAQKYGIGVVLSGTGSDGASGLRAIENAGGYGIVQEPDSAKYDGMPNSAICALQSPCILIADEIGPFIKRVVMGEDVDKRDALPEDITERIIDLISRNTSVNLWAFKRTTLERRVIRRMSILKLNTIDRYFDFVSHSADESKIFVQSLSIAVTEFFRDAKVFEELKPVIKKLLVEKTSINEPIRIWIAGCATGQESYSIAITIDQIANELGIEPNYQIFSTDISEKLIAEARRGLYIRNLMTNIDKQLIETYFDSRSEYYSAKKSIRDKIFFSAHNIAKDPHFSNIDLVSCRNVLIYLQDDAKEFALNNIYRALNQDGVFLLGTTESLGSEQKLFTSTNSDLKLYSKNTNYHQSTVSSQFQLPQIRINEPKRIKSEVLPIETQLSQLVCKKIVNPILLIDEGNQIIYTLGSISSVLDIEDGPFDRNINNLLKPEYRLTVISHINRFRKTRESENIEVMTHHSHRESILATAFLFDENRPDWMVIEIRKVRSLSNVSIEENISEKDSDIISLMRDELSVTRQSLQVAIQELENTNQELTHSNEQLQATNEEMLSSNEELIATNEELHATNEELVTVNEELEKKTYQLHNTSIDLENLQTSIELPLLVVGTDLRVKRYVNAVSTLLNQAIHDNDLITALDWKTPISNLREKVKDVITKGEKHREDISMGHGYFQLFITPYIDDEKHIKGAIIFFTDISKLTRAQTELKYEKHLADATLENISDSVIRINTDLTVDYINPAAETLCGVSEERAINKKISKFLILIDETSNEPIPDIFSETNLMNDPQTAVLLTKDNRKYIVEYFCTALTSDDNRHIGFLLLFHDVSERQAALKRVLWQSTHDHLTGLVNRKEMEDRLEKSLVAAQKNNIVSTFLYIDLDQFKVVNDTCGHIAGDELLRRITQQILKQLRSRDTLARLGGDEFGVLLDNCPLENSHQIALKIRDAVTKYRFFWDEKLFKVGSSIGIAAITKVTPSISQLYRDADTACYAAKSSGGNCIQIHLDHDKQLSQQKQQMSVVTDINDALENDLLRLYYQPIFSQQNQKITHWEVLVRMINRRHEFLLPHQFLPASERFGLIKQIDNWVIDHAMETLVDLHELTENRPKLAINLSASTLSDENSKQHLISLLKNKTNLNEQLMFEITETSALSNFDSTNQFINELRDYGCSLALDDFGTGVSTYSYLMRLDVDMIKIDGEFIRDIAENKINQEIVKSIIHISKLMNISTTAEWIHNEETCSFLSNTEVDFLQGNHISAPVPAEEFISAVVNNYTSSDYWLSARH